MQGLPSLLFVWLCSCIQCAMVLVMLARDEMIVVCVLFCANVVYAANMVQNCRRHRHHHRSRTTQIHGYYHDYKVFFLGCFWLLSSLTVLTWLFEFFFFSCFLSFLLVLPSHAKSMALYSPILLQITHYTTRNIMNLELFFGMGLKGEQ